MVKQNSNTELKVNNRWVMDTNEKKYSDRKKERKESRTKSGRVSLGVTSRGEHKG